MTDSAGVSVGGGDALTTVKPHINEKGIIRIKNGRHPVVERMMAARCLSPNDTYLDNGKNQVPIITGPNMAGKIDLYASDGADHADGRRSSFVPADEADIGLCDRIFTGNGALRMIWHPVRVPSWWR